MEIACKDEAEAQRIASTAVRERLAACANVIPSVTSFFYWEGKFTGQHEAVALLKTTEAKYARLEKRVKQLHSYGTPAIVAWKAARVEKRYAKWMKKELAGRG